MEPTTPAKASTVPTATSAVGGSRVLGPSAWATAGAMAPRGAPGGLTVGPSCAGMRSPRPMASKRERSLLAVWVLLVLVVCGGDWVTPYMRVHAYTNHTKTHAPLAPRRVVHPLGPDAAQRAHVVLLPSIAQFPREAQGQVVGQVVVARGRVVVDMGEVRLDPAELRYLPIYVRAGGSRQLGPISR